MNVSLRRRAAVCALTVAGACAGAGGAAASDVHLSVTPAHIRPGGTVTISTSPRLSCHLTLRIAGRSFSHSMKYGWVKIKMSRSDIPGRVPFTVTCGGAVATGAFTDAR
jgi:hypothetical protein